MTLAKTKGELCEAQSKLLASFEAGSFDRAVFWHERSVLLAWQYGSQADADRLFLREYLAVLKDAQALIDLNRPLLALDWPYLAGQVVLVRTRSGAERVVIVGFKLFDLAVVRNEQGFESDVPLNHIANLLS